MKKRLFFFAAAALALAACSNDEVVEVNQGAIDANAISFRPVVSNMTRASDVVADNSTYGLQTLGIKVFANVYAAGTEGANYFPETEFSWNSSSNSYNSANKYYWPADGALNFYAWAASIPAQVTHTATQKSFVVTPAQLLSATSASVQTDLVFANTNNRTKAGTWDPSSPYAAGSNTYGTNGVPLNFSHAESKVAIMIKNTNPNLKFTVGNVAIGNLYGTGTFNYTGGNDTGTSTDVNNTGTLAYTYWSWTGSQNVSYSLTMKTDDDYNILGASASEAKPIVTTDNEMILIPQPFAVQDAYSGTTAHDYSTTPETEGSLFEGSYISAQLKIQNPTNDAYIAGAADKWVTAIWPLPKMTMNPGYKYTFIVDLAGGGYYSDNQDTYSDLDPILEGAEIRFVTVTVDAWGDGGNTLLGNVIKGSTYNFNEAYNAAGTYKIAVSGLTSGSTLAASLSPAGNLSGVKILDTNGSEITTTPTSGVVTIECTLAANGENAAQATGTITLTESAGATSTTTINIVQAAGPSYAP